MEYPDVLGLVPTDDYFEVAQGLYWYCVDYHSGQWSDLYRISCELGYRPSPMENGPSDYETAQMVYDALEDGSLDAEECLSFVNYGYGETHDG